MSAAELSVRGLRKSFAGTAVLTGVELEVATDSLTAVLGPSGCGKTTLLRLLAGFERADGGSIRLGGRVLEDERTHLVPERRKIGFVPQEGALFPHLDVAANVGFGLARGERRGGRVEELLALLGLDGLGSRLPHQLSGGQQQRVALARALAPGPAVVLLDEPFDALDAGLRAQVRTEVRAALREAGATALLVTHDQEEALSLADRVAVMRDGRIVQAADPETVYRDPVDAEVAQFVGEAVLLRGQRLSGGVDTPLGLLPLRGPGGREHEPITVLLRPEQIIVGLGDAGARGTVVSASFFGHDAVARIAVEGTEGVEVLTRAVGHRPPPPGSAVTVQVEGSALALADACEPPRAHPTATGPTSPLQD
jgi:iron(III) transport system ATP-binding protein